MGCVGKGRNAGRTDEPSRKMTEMKNMLQNKYLIFISRCVLGTVFIVASVDKIANPAIFAEAVAAYKLLPYALVNAVALVVPWLELVCGVFLVSGVFLRSSSSVMFLLLCVFTVAMASAMLRNLSIDCGCFGTAHATMVGWGRVLEDIGLLALSVHIFHFSQITQGRIQNNPQTSREGSFS